MTNQLPALDVKNIDERLKLMFQQKSHVQNGFIEVGIQYVNKITGTFISDANTSYFHLRDGVFYRLDSMIYHLQLLLSVQQNQLQEINIRPFNSEKRNMMLFKSESQVYLFDSIVFHAISLFDYIGNLIDFVCCLKSQRKLKWNGVVKSVNDKTNALSTSPLAEVVRHLNSDLVDKLYRHRSHLIHYEADRAGAQATLSLQNLQSSLIVFAPKRITKTFPELNRLSKSHRLSLTYVAFWICEESLAGVAQLIDPILRHMVTYRKTSKEKEIFVRLPLGQAPAKPTE